MRWVWHSHTQTQCCNVPSSVHQCGRAPGVVDGYFPYWLRSISILFICCFELKIGIFTQNDIIAKVTDLFFDLPADCIIKKIITCVAFQSFRSIFTSPQTAKKKHLSYFLVGVWCILHIVSCIFFHLKLGQTGLPLENPGKVFYWEPAGL